MANTRELSFEWSRRLGGNPNAGDNELSLLRQVARARGKTEVYNENRTTVLRAIAQTYGKDSAHYNSLQSLRSIVDVLGVTPAGRYLSDMNERDCLQAIIAGIEDSTAIDQHLECTAIPGATGATYELQAADIGYYIRCRVTATNSEGTARAWSNSVGPVEAGVPAISYLINQNFEGVGYDNGETWTEFSSPDPNYTTTVLKGSQSLFLSTSASCLAWAGFADQATVYAHCRMRFLTFPTGDSTFLFENTAGDTFLAGFWVNSFGVVRLHANGAQSDISTTTLSLNTTYYVWLKFASSGECELAVSTTTTKPSVDGGGNIYLTKTGSAANAGRIFCYNGSDGSAIYDNVLVSASVIGNNPSP